MLCWRGFHLGSERVSYKREKKEHISKHAKKTNKKKTKKQKPQEKTRQYTQLCKIGTYHRITNGHQLLLLIRVRGRLGVHRATYQTLNVLCEHQQIACGALLHAERHQVVLCGVDEGRGEKPQKHSGCHRDQFVTVAAHGVLAGCMRRCLLDAFHNRLQRSSKGMH